MNIRTFGIITAFAFASLSFATQADDSDRVYEMGTVWSVSYIETKPGRFDDYLTDLSKVWKAYLDQQKKDGVVVSYQILTVVSPRDGEPNLMLLIESPDWASFDKADLEYFDKLAVKLQGSVSDSQAASIDRGALRELRGGILAQEVNFK